jgi:cob(I)alamin adenosyltransferase
MRIYTKTGDDGTTGLFGGDRVLKDSLRVEAYGTIDELNSVLGVACSTQTDPELRELLLRLQHDLFCLGAELACAPGKEEKLSSRKIGDEEIRQLEQAIDAHEEKLEPLRNFILPGGSEASASLHFARTVCRRAERRLLSAGREAELRGALLIYLNRLADLLFVLARRANQLSGTSDVPWAPRGP